MPDLAFPDAIDALRLKHRLSAQIPVATASHFLVDRFGQPILDAELLRQGDSTHLAAVRALLGVPALSSAMGVIVHGVTAGTARPTGHSVVTWIGSVEPTNAINDDIWEDTSA